MSDKKKKDEEKKKSAEETEDVHAEEEHHAGLHLSLESVAGAVCDAGRQAEEAFMAFVPPEVTEHLVNSKKELIRAGQRLGEKVVEDLDAKAQRAREIHEQMKAEKAAGGSKEA